MENVSFGAFNLSILNLCTMFKCKDDKHKIGIDCIEDGYSRACFGSYTDRLRKSDFSDQEKFDITMDIKLRTYEHFSQHHKDHNNFCLVGKKDIEEHFAYLRDTYDIDCDVKVFGDNWKELEDNETPNEDYFLKLHLNATPGQQVFALTWCRHLYEFPFNVFLIDALRLKREFNEFKDEHLANILQVIGSTYAKIGYYREDQCLCKPFKKLISLDRLQKHLMLDKYITTPWYPLPSESEAAIKGLPVDKPRISRSDYWLDPQTFEERKGVYLQNYMSVYNFVR